MPLKEDIAPMIFCCHLAGVYDVNRNERQVADDFTPLLAWYKSVMAQGLKGVIFHNHLSAATCARYANEWIGFERVVLPGFYSPNVYRYFVYDRYLQQHSDEITALFVTDATDVVLLKNPFVQPLFFNHPDTLFCGDEPKLLNNDWMREHGAHFRKQSADYSQFEASHAAFVLLNCGIIGGTTPVMLSLLQRLSAFHEQYNQNNPTAYTGDMGAFNFIARTVFKEKIMYGSPVNTLFKGYETEREDCWFRHK